MRRHSYRGNGSSLCPSVRAWNRCQLLGWSSRRFHVRKTTNWVVPSNLKNMKHSLALRTPPKRRPQRTTLLFELARAGERLRSGNSLRPAFRTMSFDFRPFSLYVCTLSYRSGQEAAIDHAAGFQARNHRKHSSAAFDSSFDTN